MSFLEAVEALLWLLRFLTFIRPVTFLSTVEAFHGLWRLWAIALSMSSFTAVETFHWTAFFVVVTGIGIISGFSVSHCI